MKKSIRQKKTTSASVGIPVSTFDFEKWFPWIAVAISILLYLNTLTHGYVLDDDTVIQKNSIVTKGIKAIPEIMTTPYRKGAWERQESLYRPLSLIVFATEWQLAPKHPFLGHLVNVLLYALTIFFLYKLLRRWLRQKHPFIIFSITLLFALHPLHTEVVANIKSLDELLCLLFGILSMSAFFDYAEKDQTKNLAFGAFYFFLSVMSKESSITLLAAIPLSIYFFSSADKKKYAFILGSIMLGILTYFLLRKIALGSLVNFTKIELNNNSLVAANNAIERFATAIVLIGYYIRLFFFPHPLSFDYSYNTIPIATFTDYRFLVSIALIVVAAVYSISNFKKKDAAAFGLLFFGITISIVSNIFILIEATLGERFMFIPSLGLCLFTILLLERIFKFSAKNNTTISFLFSKNTSLSAILLIVFILFFAKSFTRNRDWKSNYALFSTDKEHNPNSYRTLSAYGMEIYNSHIYPLKDGDPQRTPFIQESIEYLNKSVAINPQNYKAWNLLLYNYSQLKDYTNAVKCFEAGLSYHETETDFDKFYIMGITAYYHSGDFTKGAEVAKEALKKFPENALLWSCLGMNLTDLNQRQQAIDALHKSLAIDSTQADIWYNIGNWYAKGGDFNSALSSYAKTISIDPKHVQAMNNSGNCYAVMKQFDKALEWYQKILAIQPHNIDALRNIAAMYKNQGNLAKAAEYEQRMQ